jgi:hypothetical protein
MRKIVLSLVFSAIVLSAAVRTWALVPTLPPGGNFNLGNWYLQLPTINGVLTGTAGNVDSVSTAQLVAGFTNAYFYTGPDGAMTFRVPDNGSTTSGSAHPRSELREELAPGDTSVNWTPNGIHVMSATCVVSNVPSDTRKVCIGQVHEQVSGGSVVPMVMIMFDNNTIYANIWPDGNVDSSSSYQYGSFNIGRQITYQIAVTNGVLSLTIGSTIKTFNLFAAGYANWQTNQVYFKAGAYSQTTNQCNCDTDGALVAFYALTRYHAPGITNQPAGTNVTVGQSASFTVAASGNGTRVFQWWFNATNLLTGATYASLTVTNVQRASAGNYTVVVSDYTGSVTSSVATLAVTRATPTITVPPTASGIIYGQTLAGSTLSGGSVTNLANNSAVAGVFAFSTPTAAPGAGTAFQGVTFTPTDATNYNNAVTNVNVTVAPAILTVAGITANNKPYDGTTTATLNTGGAALVGNLDGGSVVLNTAGATGVFVSDGNIGTGKIVQISGQTISGPAASNYTLTQPATTANITAPAATMKSSSSGVMNIYFYGIPGSNYVVQTTTNLGLSWWPLITNIAGGSSGWLFSDPNATNAQQFYRLTTPQ